MSDQRTTDEGRPKRFDYCSEDCTADCGHCKGKPVESLRARLAEAEAARDQFTEKVRLGRDTMRGQLDAAEQFMAIRERQFAEAQARVAVLEGAIEAVRDQVERAIGISDHVRRALLKTLAGGDAAPDSTDEPVECGNCGKRYPGEHRFEYSHPDVRELIICPVAGEGSDHDEPQESIVCFDYPDCDRPHAGGAGGVPVHPPVGARISGDEPLIPDEPVAREGTGEVSSRDDSPNKSASNVRGSDQDEPTGCERCDGSGGIYVDSDGDDCSPDHGVERDCPDCTPGAVRGSHDVPARCSHGQAERHWFRNPSSLDPDGMDVCPGPAAVVPEGGQQ